MNPCQRWTLRVVCVSTALLLLNVAAPNVALPDIQDDLGASFADVQWVLSGYALALAVLLLSAGSLADRYGRKRLFIIGLAVFNVASVLCAAAPSPLLLIVARVIQGVGAAIVFPSSLALLAEEFEGPARRRAIGVWGAVIGLAFAIGPLVGGVLVEAASWRGIFLLNLALGLPAVILGRRYLRESRDPAAKAVDWRGATVLSAGLFAIVFAVLRGNALGWTSATVLGCFATGVVLLGAFVALERSRVDPMIELELFRNRTFTGASIVVLLLGGATFGGFVYLALFLLDVQGRSPTEAGLVLMPLAAVSFVVSLVAGRLNEHVPLRGALALGMVVTAAGGLLLSATEPDASWLALLPGLVVSGAGAGLVNPLTVFAHLGVLSPAHSGLASAINNTGRQIGLAIGIAALGALLDSRIPDGARGAAYETAFTDALDELYLIIAGLTLLGAVAAFVLVRTDDLWSPPAAPVDAAGNLYTPRLSKGERLSG
ncbi:MAG TPA: MFS transporter [Thermoleophilaceae bacterium]|nr:MFS transporter [Thermoleophilaceae bacterium]